MAKNDFQYGGWNYYTLQCGTIMTLISPADYTLQCGMWLWNHDIEFTKWQHPAMWYVALGWHAVKFAGGSTLQCGWWLWDDMPWNSPKRPPYWNSTSGVEFDHITAVDCHSAPVCEILSKSDHPQQKKNDVMPIFKMVDISHLGF